MVSIFWLQAGHTSSMSTRWYRNLSLTGKKPRQHLHEKFKIFFDTFIFHNQFHGKSDIEPLTRKFSVSSLYPLHFYHVTNTRNRSNHTSGMEFLKSPLLLLQRTTSWVYLHPIADPHPHAIQLQLAIFYLYYFSRKLDPFWDQEEAYNAHCKNTKENKKINC